MAVGANLSVRIPTADNLCPHCGEPETTEHLLFFCNYAKELWVNSPLQNPPPIHTDLFISLLLKDIKDRAALPRTGVTTPLGLWICWHIWKAMNNLMFNKVRASTREVISLVVSSAREWSQVNGFKTKVSPPLVNPHIHATTEFLCQIDVAWNIESKEAGMGWILSLNSPGASQTHHSSTGFASSPLVAEGIAIRDALSKAIMLGIRTLSVQSDSLQLIRAINHCSSVSKLHS